MNQLPLLQQFNIERTKVENDRKVSLKRIQTELARIRSEEKAYGKDLLKKMIPVRVTLNPKLVESIKEKSPFSVEIVDNKKEKVVNEVVKPNEAELNIDM